MRTREALSALIEGRLASPAGRSELVELATRLIVEEALEGEVRDALDRGYYERGDAPGRGHRNGHRTHRLKTAEGGLEYSAPQVAGLEQPFRSALPPPPKFPADLGLDLPLPFDSRRAASLLRRISVTTVARCTTRPLPYELDPWRSRTALGFYPQVDRGGH
jgi:hypothetical protein